MFDHESEDTCLCVDTGPAVIMRTLPRSGLLMDEKESADKGPKRENDIRHSSYE